MQIALIGYGKMGRAIEAIALQEHHDIVLKINRSNPQDLNTENLRKASVAIEFTGPETAAANMHACFQAGIPVVCGSTGWLSAFESVQRDCEAANGTLLYASNFSIGVNIFFEINRQLAALMSAFPDYRVDIKETHHTQKKDAPSGTAISLAEQLLAALPGKKGWVNEASTDPAQIPILSERIDPAPGTHEVSYRSSVDDIQIVHTAHNRQGFASGAVRAAEYIQDKKGIFTIKNVLGL